MRRENLKPDNRDGLCWEESFKRGTTVFMGKKCFISLYILNEIYLYFILVYEMNYLLLISFSSHFRILLCTGSMVCYTYRL